MLFNIQTNSFEMEKEPVPPNCYPVCEDEIRLISQSLTGGGYIWAENGKLKWSGKKPSDKHKWDEEKKSFVRLSQAELEEKQAALLAQQQEQVLAQINAKRDECVNGGVYVEQIQKWIDTDEKGRATLVEIKADFDLNGKDNSYTLICSDDTARTINFDEFKAVWDAVKTLKEKMFENAYMHKILLEQAENPLEYDWSIGWSRTYAESQH